MGLNFHAIGAGQQILNPEFAAPVAGDFTLERRFGRPDDDFRSGDSAAAGVLDDAAECAARILGRQRR